jgi:hypothetical protein
VGCAVAGQRHAAFLDGDDSLAVHLVAARHGFGAAVAQLEQRLRIGLRAERAEQDQCTAKVMGGLRRRCGDLWWGCFLCHVPLTVVSLTSHIGAFAGDEQRWS